VLDPLENLFPMDLDVPRRIDSDTNLGTIHTKDRQYKHFAHESFRQNMVWRHRITATDAATHPVVW
jgi:hypothetical protein